MLNLSKRFDFCWMLMFQSPEGLRSKQIDDWVVFLDYLWAKGRQIFWICLSVYFLWNSNIFNVALECNSIHGSFFNSVLFSGIVLLLMITFGTIGPIYFDLPNIEEKFPWIMPITAISCLYFFFCGIALMWPLFSVWIIPIFVSFFLGFVNIGNILPNHKISTFIMFGCLLCSILSFKIIPHSGFLHDLNSCYA